MNPLDLLNMRKMALSGANRRPAAAAFLEQPLTSSADIADAKNAYSRQGLQAGALAEANRGMSNVEAARLRALKALGAPQQPTPTMTKPTLITPTSAASGAGSLLPGRGTPGSAALGAFGQTMSQLGGWQDKPMTFGQIMGASLGKAREAYGTAEDRQIKIAAEKAAAERQAEQDELSRKNIESQIKVREQPKEKKEPKIITRTLPDGSKQDYVFDPESPRADQYGLSPYGESYSSIKDVAPTAKMQEIAQAYGGLDTPEAQEALKRAIEGSTKGKFQSKGTVINKDGVEVGAAVFDTSTGRTMLSVTGPNGEELVPLPEGSDVVSVGQESKVIMNVDKLNNLEEKIDLSIMSMQGLTSYLESIDKAPVGLNRLYSSFVADTKTLFSDLVDADIDGKKFTDLSEGELNIALSTGKLQSLIGQFRLETVGGGVMTEQDAIRILWSLGGDVGALQKPEVVKDAMTRMFKKKYKNLKRQVRQYNAQVRQPVYESKGYAEVEIPYFDESLLSEKVISESRKVGSVPKNNKPAASAPANADALNNALSLY